MATLFGVLILNFRGNFIFYIKAHYGSKDIGKEPRVHFAINNRPH